MAMLCFMVVSIANVIVPKNPLTGMCEFNVTVGLSTCVMVMDCGANQCVDNGNVNVLQYLRYGCLPPVPPGGSAAVYQGPYFIECDEIIVDMGSTGMPKRS
jgi:hypothetical protein